MTSKEIIKSVIHFKHPDRIGLSFNPPNISDIAMIGGLKLDRGELELSEWGFHEKLLRKVPRFNGQVRQDDFGTIWGRIDRTSCGESIRGFLQTDQDDWSSLDEYVLPEISKNSLEKVKADCVGKDGLYLIGGLPCFTFAQMREIRGMQYFLLDVLLHEEEVERLASMLKDLAKRCIGLYAAAGMDAVMFWEDWGTQQAMLISPTCWRKIFKPAYRELASFAHQNGMDIIMHSCGYIFEIIGDIIESGIDVLQLDQPSLMGMERLSREFGGRVTFYSPVDTQAFLPSGDRDIIENEARRMLELFGNFGGGFIAMDYGSLDAIGVRDEWAQWARDVFINEGRYI
jgi:uroporphyrinogen decarboxylase